MPQVLSEPLPGSRWLMEFPMDRLTGFRVSFLQMTWDEF